MPLLRVVDQRGAEHEIEGAAGLRLMDVLRELDFGVPAICGGMCSCATCHVYVDRAWLECLPTPMSDERELLEELTHGRPESRLSCQIQLTDSLSGLRVTIAPEE